MFPFQSQHRDCVWASGCECLFSLLLGDSHMWLLPSPPCVSSSPAMQKMLFLRHGKAIIMSSCPEVCLLGAFALIGKGHLLSVRDSQEQGSRDGNFQLGPLYNPAIFQCYVCDTCKKPPLLVSLGGGPKQAHTFPLSRYRGISVPRHLAFEVFGAGASCGWDW